ncbi:MAG: DUF4153 domain-containing protein [Allopontixanthobacter sediminis]
MTPDTQASPVQFDSDWSLRPWVLGLLLGVAGLLVYLITDGNDQSRGHMALAAFVFFSAMFAAFTLNRGRWIEPTLAAVIAGVVMAGLAWQAVDPNDWLADEDFAFGAGVVAITLSLPLFQAGFHRLRFRTPYRDTHFHVWTDIVSGAGALVFVGLSWALIAVLSELFHLLQIDLLKNLIDEEWFGWTYSGLTFGAALGTLRNQLRILGTLQSVVLLVLSLLAVPLAAALVLFLAAMIMSGPDVLWEATRSATPILLACAFGAFVLTNAIIRDDDSEMTTSRIMRITALILALGILPLTVFAAISMGTRVAQYGLSPERIWGLIAIGFACAYGFAYVVALVRGRKAGWHDALRRANLHLAVAGCALAFIVALPLFDVGAMSARNQIARMEAGKVSVEDFDYAALRWDFGESGRQALRELARSENAEMNALATKALAEKERSYRYPSGPDDEQKRAANLRMDFSDPVLRQKAQSAVLGLPWACHTPCVLIDLGAGAGGIRRLAKVENFAYTLFEVDLSADATHAPNNAELGLATETPQVKVEAGSKVEVRPFTGRQIYVDGKPLGVPFE